MNTLLTYFLAALLAVAGGACAWLGWEAHSRGVALTLAQADGVAKAAQLAAAGIAADTAQAAITACTDANAANANAIAVAELRAHGAMAMAADNATRLAAAQLEAKRLHEAIYAHDPATRTLGDTSVPAALADELRKRTPL